MLHFYQGLPAFAWIGQPLQTDQLLGNRLDAGTYIAELLAGFCFLKRNFVSMRLPT